MAGLAPDMLVSDLVMAGMDGLALVCAARRTRPGLQALLVTGHAGDVTPAPLAAAAGGRPLRPALFMPTGGLPRILRSSARIFLS